MKFLALTGVLVIGVCIFSGVVTFLQGNQQAGGALDGSEIQPLYEVVIIQKDRSSKSFACLVSAGIWFNENIKQISSVLVTDEASGKKISAQDAFYVLSEVVTTPYTGNRIHVFAEKAKALSHAGRFKGKLVKNPFLPKKSKPVLLVKQKAGPRNGHDFFAPDSQNPLSLTSKTALLNRQDYSCLPREYTAALAEEHFNPPDKPPMISA